MKKLRETSYENKKKLGLGGQTLKKEEVTKIENEDEEKRRSCGTRRRKKKKREQERNDDNRKNFLDCNIEQLRTMDTFRSLRKF